MDLEATLTDGSWRLAGGWQVVAVAMVAFINLRLGLIFFSNFQFGPYLKSLSFDVLPLNP